MLGNGLCRHSPSVADQRLGNLGDGQHVVHCAGDIALRGMLVIAGLLGILRDDQPGLFLHGFEPEAAVGAGS